MTYRINNDGDEYRGRNFASDLGIRVLDAAGEFVMPASE